MLLTKQQRFLLDALKRTGGLREDQMIALLRPAFCGEKPEIAPCVVEAALRQLRGMSVVLREKDKVYWLGRDPPDRDLLDAVDVMNQLSGGAPIEYWRAKAPILLRFYVQEKKVRAFSVVNESADLRDADFPLNERIILLFDGQGQPKALPVSNKQFIAVRQKDGGFRFYARDGQSKQS